MGRYLIDFSRPNKPVEFSYFETLFNIQGKTIIRLAWDSLIPDKDGWIQYYSLKKWIESFFNFKTGDYDSDGAKAISHLNSIGLLAKTDFGGFFNSDYYCKPLFEL